MTSSARPSRKRWPQRSPRCRILLRSSKAVRSLSVCRRPLGRWLSEFEQALPHFRGERISLRFRPRLSASRGRIDYGHSGGKAIWAASFIRLRRTVLDCELLEHESALRGILIHELFHFV